MKNKSKMIKIGKNVSVECYCNGESIQSMLVVDERPVTYECIPLVNLEVEKFKENSANSIAEDTISVLSAISETDQDLQFYTIRIPNYEDLVMLIENTMEEYKCK